MGGRWEEIHSRYRRTDANGRYAARRWRDLDGGQRLRARQWAELRGAAEFLRRHINAHCSQQLEKRAIVLPRRQRISGGGRTRARPPRRRPLCPGALRRAPRERGWPGVPRIPAAAGASFSGNLLPPPHPPPLRDVVAPAYGEGLPAGPLARLSETTRPSAKRLRAPFARGR